MHRKIKARKWRDSKSRPLKMSGNEGMTGHTANAGTSMTV
jgi:hypothetical protein